MPLDFMSKVKYLCRVIREVEWSGVLWYTMEGSMNKPESVVITLKDILLMDKGTKTLTEYDFDKDESLAMDIVDLMMTKPEYKTYIRGLIHSHNDMKVFFSGTDNEELLRSSEYYNFYLSLIVNNNSDFTAKVAFRGKAKSDAIQYYAKNEKGESYTVGESPVESEFVFTYDCNIVDPIEVDETFVNRSLHIINKAADRDKLKLASATNNSKVNHIGFSNHNLQQNSWTDKAFSKQTNAVNSLNEMFGEEQDLIDAGIIAEIYYDFAAFLLRLGNIVTGPDGNDDVEDAIEDAFITGVSDELPSAIMEQFMDLHSRFFSSNANANDSEFILDSLSNVITVFEEHEETYPWITNITLGLKSFGTKLSYFLNEPK